MNDERTETISFRELPPAQSGSPIAAEWDTYREQVPHLLEQGLEGKFTLIQGKRIVGIWDTREEVEAVARQKFLLQPVLIHQIRSREPMVRGPLLVRLCQP
jgi:hypothetical protein